jgi:hypothetical protein
MYEPSGLPAEFSGLLHYSGDVTMTSEHWKRAAAEFFASILLGVGLFAVPFAIMYFLSAWAWPDSGEEKTGPQSALWWAGQGLYAGTFIGGIAGAILGGIRVARRLQKADGSTN